MTKGQSLVIALALILTALATAVVLWYPSSVEEPDFSRVSRVAIVVSKVDIPAGTDMNQLIKDDQFRLIEVPKDAAAEGAVTSVDQLSDRHNSVKIWHGELIPVGRMWSVDAMRRERLEFTGG